MQKATTWSEAIITKYPEQVAVAIAKDAAGKHNPISLGWAMQTSHKPPMLAFSVGLTRYSLGVIRAAKEFVVALPSAEQEAEVMLFGTKSGRDTDKLAEAGAKTRPAAKIDSVLLADAVANFECRLAGELATGDHVIFVGEVVCSYVNEKRLNRLYTVGPGPKMAGLPQG
ncbi:MAG TPA: flavin reductase family protein [Phycisphaerae bacterium]|nr:flavin reductase family protein [Phycisphaerae bacterium]